VLSDKAVEIPVKCVALALFAGMTLAGSATAGGFGIGFGAPLEERTGGDYGPEYYRALHAPVTKADAAPTRCRSKLMHTREGLRRTRRCS
jgi:hypothetical protein